MKYIKLFTNFRGKFRRGGTCSRYKVAQEHQNSLEQESMSLSHVSSNNSKILITDILHQLELIIASLGFVKIFSLRKTTSQTFDISQNLHENQ